MGAGITTPVLVKGYGTLTPCTTTGFPMCGTYTIDNPGSLSVSSETMILSGVTEGGAIAPGAALTVENPGTGATYPVTNWSAMTGVMPFNGQYSTSLLGGTPSHIQAQVSATPGGAALSGCSACAWTNVSSEVISGGSMVRQRCQYSGRRTLLGFVPGREWDRLRYAAKLRFGRG